MVRAIEPEELEAEIARLRGLGLPALRAEWEQHHGTAVPRTIRRDLLVRSIAWRIQAKALGGIKPAVLKYLRQVAEGARSGTVVPPASHGRIKPGTRLIRVWQDQTHTVTVLADGFEWQGRRHRSLSEIARAITGTRWNGLVFFGLKARASDSRSTVNSRAVGSAKADRSRLEVSNA